MPSKLILTILSIFLLSFIAPVNIASGLIMIPPSIDIILNPAEFTTANNRPAFSWQTSSIEASPPFYHTLYISASDDIFSAIVLEKYIGAENNYTLSAEEVLLPGDYFWQIFAHTDINTGWAYGYSPIELLTISAEPAIDPLILKYEPILYFHPNEDFFPMSIESFVSHSSLWDSQGINPDQEIKAESDTNPVNLDDLTPQGQDTVNWYLQFSQDLPDKTPDPAKAKTEYQELKSNSQAQPTYYARKMEDSFTDDQNIVHNFIVLQYWYFYAFNDFGAKVDKGNNHEGDWETVMIFLDKETQEPQYVAYSQHHNEGQLSDPVMQYSSVRRDWLSPETSKQGDQIISFTALGSHANYPNNGENGQHDILLLDPIEKLFFANYDFTSKSGPHFIADNWQSLEVFDNNNLPKWVSDYQGRWGVKLAFDTLYQQSGSIGLYHSDKGEERLAFHHPIQWAGLDKIGKLTITEQGILAINFINSNSKIVFDQALSIGAKITVDLHNEIINIGQNARNIILAPHFWDITSNLINNTFQAEVGLIYNPTELDTLGIDNPTKLTAFIYNETEQFWQIVPSIVDIANNLIKFKTNHFSRYAIGIKQTQFQDITDKVKVAPNNRRYDRRAGIHEIGLKIQNKTQTEITGRLVLSIYDLSEGIEFVNPDDLTSLSLISTGLPEDLKGVDFSDSYHYCLFTGQETDIPATVDDKTKNRLLKEKPIKDKKCSEIILQYPELALFLKNVLPAKGFTENKRLQFKDLNKSRKRFNYEVRVWGEVVE